MEFILYSSVLGTTTPIYNIYQLYKLNKFNCKTMRYPLFNTCLKIYPSQILLRGAQLGAVHKIKNIVDDDKSVLVSFGFIGITQSLIYGHANHSFGQTLKLSTSKNWIRTSFRGSVWGCSRDILSQGMPFLITKKDDQVTHILSASLLGTLISHSLHNAQTWMQTHKDATYRSTIVDMCKKYGSSWLWKGVSGRILILGITNILNHYCLKKNWN
jgi:hypothetical protein